MKKRRDLDALVQNKKTRKKRGQHSLLRDASESSDNEEFSVCEKSIGNSRKNSGRTCGYCALGLASISLIFFAVLLWFTMKLSYDISALQKELKDYQRLPKPTEEPAVSDLQKAIKSLKDHISSIQMKSNKTLTRLSHRIDRLNTTIGIMQVDLKKQTGSNVDDITRELTKLGSALKSLENNDLRDIRSSINKNFDKILLMNISYFDNLLSINQDVELLKTKIGKDESQDARNISGIVEKIIRDRFVNQQDFMIEIKQLKEIINNLSSSYSSKTERLKIEPKKQSDENNRDYKLLNSTVSPLHSTGSEELKKFLDSLKLSSDDNPVVKLDDLVQYSKAPAEQIKSFDLNKDEKLDKDELYRYFNISA